MFVENGHDRNSTVKENKHQAPGTENSDTTYRTQNKKSNLKEWM